MLLCAFLSASGQWGCGEGSRRCWGLEVSAQQGSTDCLPRTPSSGGRRGDPQSCREPLTGTPGSGHARRGPGWLENRRSAVGKTASVPLPRASGTRAVEGAGVRCEQCSGPEDPPWPHSAAPPPAAGAAPHQTHTPDIGKEWAPPTSPHHWPEAKERWFRGGEGERNQVCFVVGYSDQGQRPTA